MIQRVPLIQLDNLDRRRSHKTGIGRFLWLHLFVLLLHVGLFQLLHITVYKNDLVFLGTSVRFHLYIDRRMLDLLTVLTSANDARASARVRVRTRATRTRRSRLNTTTTSSSASIGNPGRKLLTISTRNGCYKLTQHLCCFCL